MNAKDLLSRFPIFWRTALIFVFRPRQFPGTVLAEKAISAKETLAWIVPFSLLLVNLYGVVFGSFATNLATAGTILPQKEPVHQAAHPTIHELFWALSGGIGVNPSSWTSEEPQRVAFQFGAGIVVLDGIKLHELTESAVLPLFLMLYAFSSIICFHFPARILKGTAPFAVATRLSQLYFGYVWLMANVLAVAAVLLFHNVLRLRGLAFLLASDIFVVVPFGIVAVRSFFLVFSEAYQISKWRVFFAGIGGWLLSIAIFPALFVPALYVIVRFTALWKSVL